MAFTWNSSLETGCPVIDAQHKELIVAVNNFLTVCQQGQAAGMVRQKIDFLTSYTKKHFAEEEALQKKFAYPDYTNHCKLHGAFVATVNELSAQLAQSGPTPVLVNKIIRNIGDWLVNHIKKEDAKVAAHLKDSGA